MEDRKSWAVKDEAVLEDLVSLMALTDEEKSALVAAKAQAEGVAPQMVEAFYERLLAHPNTAEYLEGKTDHLKNSLKGWFAELFSGDYTQDYVRSRLQIGKTHVRIGLPVRYPLAMLDVIFEFGEKAVADSAQPEQAMAAFHKLVSLDIAIFNQSYESTQLQHLAEMVGNETLARRLLTQE